MWTKVRQCSQNQSAVPSPYGLVGKMAIGGRAPFSVGCRTFSERNGLVWPTALLLVVFYRNVLPALRRRKSTGQSCRWKGRAGIAGECPGRRRNTAAVALGVGWPATRNPVQPQSLGDALCRCSALCGAAKPAWSGFAASLSLLKIQEEFDGIFSEEQLLRIFQLLLDANQETH